MILPNYHLAKGSPVSCLTLPLSAPSQEHTARNQDIEPKKNLQKKTMPRMLQINFNPNRRTPALYLALLVLYSLHAHLAICNAVPVRGGHAARGGEIDVALTRACSRSIGDCLPEAEAMEMESETSRRVLLMQQKKYISYETLRRDLVPCTTAGASYYNCHSGTANQYNRGCEVITWCARNIRDIKT